MVDLAPNNKRIAQLMRMLGSTGGERRAAFAALERAMQSACVSWTDIGNAVEHGLAEGKFTEDEMLEFAQAARAEGVEAGIKIGAARAAHNGSGASNGHLTLPSPAEMADFCHTRQGALKDDKQRSFIGDMYLITRRGASLSPKRLAYLTSIYIGIGGKTG